MPRDFFFRLFYSHCLVLLTLCSQPFNENKTSTLEENPNLEEFWIPKCVKCVFGLFVSFFLKSATQNEKRKANPKVPHINIHNMCNSIVKKHVQNMNWIKSNTQRLKRPNEFVGETATKRPLTNKESFFYRNIKTKYHNCYACDGKGNATEVWTKTNIVVTFYFSF